jgi:hypothetical protein
MPGPHGDGGNGTDGGDGDRDQCGEGGGVVDDDVKGAFGHASVDGLK